MGLHFETSDETCEYVRSQTDVVFVGFSTGKDSCAAWLKMRRFWKKDQIIPIIQLFVPGAHDKQGRGTLPYLEKTLAYYEEFFGTRIYRVPHISFYASMSGKTHQPPERFDGLEYLNSQGYFPILAHEEYNKWIRTKIGIPGAWHATGIRMHDNLMRRTAIKRHGSVQTSIQTFYPVWDYRIEDVRTAIRDANITLSSDYNWFSRSIGGIDARFAWPLRLQRDRIGGHVELCIKCKVLRFPTWHWTHPV